MGNCLFMRKGAVHTAPTRGILLKDMAEGSVVKINENGTPAEFYVACHNYESALNGAGRTLLVRKDCNSSRVFHATTNGVAFSSSDLCEWLNGTYKSMLDEIVQIVISTTAFYVTNGFSQYGVTTLERAVFLPSMTEYGMNADGMNEEGTSLPNGRDIAQAQMDGTNIAHWTRTPNTTTTYKIFAISAMGRFSTHAPNVSNGVRPCFTLPEQSLFDETTLGFKGVV